MQAIEIVKEQMKAYEEHRNFAVVTIIESAGSTPRRNGKMIVFENRNLLTNSGFQKVKMARIEYKGKGKYIELRQALLLCQPIL